MPPERTADEATHGAMGRQARMEPSPDRWEPAHDALPSSLRGASDEELVVLAKQYACRPAVNELILRYYGWMRCLIGRRARRMGFGDVDIQDAQQEHVFAIVEAITKFDTVQQGKSRRCSFLTFLHLVLVARFKDFIKRLRRARRGARSVGLQLSWCTDEMNDPALSVEWHELLGRLDQALHELDDSLVQVWEHLAAGLRLRAIAAELGLSYDVAKRRRQRLLQELRSRLL
jgi:RNA polymerase sigma factor (sigma-70 family)